jgi:hypothetical protein
VSSPCCKACHEPGATALDEELASCSCMCHLMTPEDRAKFEAGPAYHSHDGGETWFVGAANTMRACCQEAIS